MEIPFYQVDAFTTRVFGGNPAAVCPLTEWLDDATMQNIAMENALSETAFFVREGDTRRLRWFTPACEVDLCGHATLATAWVIMNRLEPEAELVSFETLSGTLEVTRDGDIYTLDFPARRPNRLDTTHQLSAALGIEPRELWAARDYMAVLGSEEEVRNLRPDMAELAKFDTFAVIVTAPGNEVDFVSRFFAPAQGVPEDPVTGSAHCTLIPYWADVLDKTAMTAHQVSARGGELLCRLEGERVKIGGGAVLFAEGRICV